MKEEMLMKKFAAIIGIALLVMVTGCAASSTQSQMASVKNPMRNASTSIKLARQKVRIMKNTQQLPNAVQQSVQ